MSRYTEWENSEPEFLSSVSGWGEVIRWAEQLPNRDANFPELSLLTNEGYTEEPTALLEELPRASAALPPPSNIVAILETLKETLENRGDKTVLCVTEGIVSGQFAQWEDGESEFLTSVFGWGDFKKWVELLPNQTDFPQLNRLIEEGICEAPTALQEELVRATTVLPPDPETNPVIDYSVMDTLHFLNNFLENRGERTTLTITTDADDESIDTEE